MTMTPVVTTAEHEDALADLDRPLSLGRKLAIVHDALRKRLPFVGRIAVASYDPCTAVVKTFVASGATQSLVRYETTLAEAPSLRETFLSGRPRVVNDLSVFASGTHEHTRKIWAHGFRASYTLPLVANGAPWGFLFFNSPRPGTFTPAALAEIDVFAHLIASLALQDLIALGVLRGALTTAVDMVHERDPGTGAHLERMARFSRLIARELADAGVHDFDDEFIERVFLFAPLHDVGKIGIPDRILLKGDSLTTEEREVMRSHPERGARIVDSIARNFHLGGLPFLGVLRNVAELHHEALDGSGYPHGLRDGQIPVEARIVAVADIFDALTSRRSYKARWTNDEAFSALRVLAGVRLDADCVEALVRRRGEAEEIQARFQETTDGGDPR